MEKPNPNTYKYNQSKTIDATYTETMWYKVRYYNDENNGWFYVWSKNPLAGDVNNLKTK